jgi:hypothetical protein
MNKPAINTAIPKRRYQIGSYTGVLLGDIESGDTNTYLHILAMVAEGSRDPVLYVIAQKNGRQADLRLESELLSDILDTSASWKNLDTFADKAMELAASTLGLSDQQARRLM